MEGYEDHSVDVLFFWDASDQLIATVVNCLARRRKWKVAPS